MVPDQYQTISIFPTHLISRYYLPFSYLLRPKPMVVPYCSLPTHLSRKFADVCFERETQQCQIAQIFTILFVYLFPTYFSTFFLPHPQFSSYLLNIDFIWLSCQFFLKFFLAMSSFPVIFFFLSFYLSPLLFLMFPSMTLVLLSLKMLNEIICRQSTRLIRLMRRRVK